MTWPHVDPGLAPDREQEKALKEARGCGGYLYLGWGPGIRAACTHPEHPCTDATRLERWCLGCADRVPREGGQIHAGAPRPWPAPVDLAGWVERWTEGRLAERVRERRKAA